MTARLLHALGPSWQARVWLLIMVAYLTGCLAAATTLLTLAVLR